MSKIKTFEDLEVWQNASNIAIEVYKISSIGKLSKDYGLKDQIQRASISISNNISEGFEYDNNKDFIKYLRFAKGSAGEVRSMKNFLYKIDYVNKETYKKFYEELISISKQLKGFINYLKQFNTKNI
jgi:four helix bundle protein